MPAPASARSYHGTVTGITVAEVLRSARGNTRSQRNVAAAAGISVASLSRYEAGSRLPSGDMLAALDRELGLGGSLVALGQLQRSKARLPKPASLWNHMYAPKWSGPVWFEVLPVQAGDHDLRLRWGPWGHRFQRRLPMAGAVLMTMKAQEDASTVLELLVTPPAVVRFGAGDASKFPNAESIYYGWEPVEESDLMRMAGKLLNDALRFCGRTPDDLAHFLNVPIATVVTFLEGRPLSISAKDSTQRPTAGES